MLDKNIDLSGKRVIVTGAAGFIGSNLCMELIKRYSDIQILGIDNVNDYYDVGIKKDRLKRIAEILGDKVGTAGEYGVSETIGDSRFVFRVEFYSNRYKELYNKGLVSADEYESARLQYLQAKEQVNTSKESVQKAQTNLGYATITSPIDGVILSKSVEEGQTVAASFNTPELFVIAQDLTDMRVIADIDEADIGGVKEGQRVSFTVDAFPDDQFEGRVTQVRQQATTESNVVTYEVVISAPNNDLKLKPGLTANVTIFTLEKNDVLAVPSKALRFHPNEALLQKGETIEDCEGDHKLWTKEGTVFKAHKVEVGTSNGIMTEITGGMKVGTEILTDFNISGGAGEAEQQQASNPFMPRPGGNRNNNNNKQGGQAGGGAPQR